MNNNRRTNLKCDHYNSLVYNVITNEVKCLKCGAEFEIVSHADESNLYDALHTLITYLSTVPNGYEFTEKIYIILLDDNMEINYSILNEILKQINEGASFHTNIKILLKIFIIYCTKYKKYSSKNKKYDNLKLKGNLCPSLDKLAIKLSNEDKYFCKELNTSFKLIEHIVSLYDNVSFSDVICSILYYKKQLCGNYIGLEILFKYFNCSDINTESYLYIINLFNQYYLKYKDYKMINFDDIEAKYSYIHENKLRFNNLDVRFTTNFLNSVYKIPEGFELEVDSKDEYYNSKEEITSSKINESKDSDSKLSNSPSLTINKYEGDDIHKELYRNAISNEVFKLLDNLKDDEELKIIKVKKDN